MLRVTIALCAIWTPLYNLGLSASIGASQSTLPPTVSPLPPVDVSIPDDFSGNPIAFFDDYSWQMFVAINWPSLANARGLPDEQRQFGADNIPSVWESWKADHELLQPGGQRPSEWDSLAAISPCVDVPIDNAGARKVLGIATQSGTAMEHFNQAAVGTPIGTLVDQNRQYVMYEIRVNRTEYEFIRGRDDEPAEWRYLRKNLPPSTDDPLQFPSGSIEVKAAWRRFRLPEDASLLTRYHLAKALVVDPVTRQCTEQTLGLVGLHIVHRTPSRPEWIWSTFEHVDNLNGARPTFNDSQGSQDPSSAQNNRLQPIVDKNHPPLTNPQPVQVVRIKPIHESTMQTNELYQRHPAVRDTVWKNYQLVASQWPTQPAENPTQFAERFRQDYPVGAGTPFPVDAAPPAPLTGTSIANAVMETSREFQRRNSCMACHFSKLKPNQTEFVWFLALRAHPADDAESLEAYQRLDAASQELVHVDEE